MKILQFLEFSGKNFVFKTFSFKEAAEGPISLPARVAYGQLFGVFLGLIS